MLMLKALKNRSVLKLWMGQVGSSVGDEVYRVAFVWIAVKFIGADTGYLSSLQLLAVFLFGVFGGKFADRVNPYLTMVWVDLIRAGITLIPVVLFYLHLPSFTALVISAVLLSGLGAFFEPALQCVLPIAAKDSKTLKAANGLMSTTLRLARVLGPCVIGVMSLWIQEIHFFTLNAFSYLLSTLSVFSIRRSIAHVAIPSSVEETHVFSNLFQSLKVLHEKPAVARALYLKTLCGGAWGLVYGLGLALLVHEMNPDNVKAYGLLMGAYGLGNILAAIVVGNLERKNPEWMVYLGLFWLGIFFSGIALTHSFVFLLIFAALSAVGGPLNDLPFTDLLQAEFTANEWPKVFRLRMIFENLFSLGFMLISPYLFKAFSIHSVILVCGILILMMGAYGLKVSAKK